MKVTNCMIYYNNRLLLVKCKPTPNNRKLIQVYKPIFKSDNKEVKEVYADIEEIMQRLQKRKTRDNVIVMGDINIIFCEGREDGYFDFGKRNTRGEKLVVLQR